MSSSSELQEGYATHRKRHLGKSLDFIGNSEKFSVGFVVSGPNKRFFGSSLKNTREGGVKTLLFLGFIYFFGYTTLLGVLVPLPGIKPMFPAVEA